jgi:type II secretory pathway pseudopilin PulG
MNVDMLQNLTLVEITIIGILILSILLIVISFFKKDRIKELEEQIEQLSLQMMQENYQIKKKLKLFEEELFIRDENVMPLKRERKLPDRETILELYYSGYSYEEIADQYRIGKDEIELILNER